MHYICSVYMSGVGSALRVGTKQAPQWNVHSKAVSHALVYAVITHGRRKRLPTSVAQ